jgi:DNA polymerase-3 subunit delta'
MQFAQVTGHAEIKSRLIRGISEGRIPHAQLFVSGPGGGNLPMALAYIQFLLCKTPLENDSCGSCDACLKVQNLAHPDLHFIFPFVSQGGEDICLNYMEDFRSAVKSIPYMDLNGWMQFCQHSGKSPKINVASCNTIFRTLSMRPYEGKFQFMVIWLPEVLQPEGSNRLLKIIEEPPENTLFILVSHEEERVLATILSRTQRVKLKRIPDFDMLTFLSETLQVPLEKGQEIVNMSDGNLGLALSLTRGEGSQQEWFAFFQEWMRCSWTGSFHRATQLAEHFHKMGRESQQGLFSYGLYLMRETLVFKEKAPVLRISEKERHWLSKFEPVLNNSQLEGIVLLLERGILDLNRNAYAKLTFLQLSAALHLLFRDSGKKT